MENQPFPPDLGGKNVSSGRTDGHRTVLGGKRESSGRTDNYRLRLRLKAAYARPRREASECYLEWSALDAAPTTLCSILTCRRVMNKACRLMDSRN